MTLSSIRFFIVGLLSTVSLSVGSPLSAWDHLACQLSLSDPKGATSGLEQGEYFFF